MKKLLSFILSLAVCVPCVAVVSAEQPPNAAPTVLPAVREWEGASGSYDVSKCTRIVMQSSDTLAEDKQAVISGYFSDILGFEPEFVVGTPGRGDISLSTCDDEGLGDEGYLLDVVSDGVDISAPSQTGLLYGIITLLQSQLADGSVPCGTARDYPEYPVRGGMIDVGRAYMPLDYVEEITRYMAWFKLNEVHLHINDTGENGYTAFRLESDIEGLTSEDGSYSKEEYREYQKRALSYGVTVITEIDTPAHSACFSDAFPPEYMLDSNHIDISNPEAVDAVKKLFDEYLTGDDPVFVSKIVHIGTDEYPAEYAEQMRAYVDELIKHVRSRGYTPRFWGSFGKNGFNGATPVSGDAQANFWAVDLSDYKVLLEMGYDLINTCGPVLYVVPGGNYGFVDYYNLDSMYENWFVNYMGTSPADAIAPDHEQLLGANFALWNDRYTAYGGFSVFDIFDRLRGQICFISEKTWCGPQTSDIDADDFVKRYEFHSVRAGSANPGRYHELPLESTEGIDSVGFPYHAKLTFTLKEYGSTLLSGADGSLYVNKDGQLCFARGGYIFTFDCKLPLGESTVELAATTSKTTLVLDDTYVYEAVNNKNSTFFQSSTFVLPLEKLGDGEKCQVSSVSVTAEGYDLTANRVDGNYALGCPVTVSGLEVDYGILNEPLAVDGNPDTRLSFARDKDEQWMIVDLGSVKPVNRVEIDLFEHISEYSLYVSEDGEEYTEVYSVTGGSEGVRQRDVCEFDTVNARYVKYVQHKRYYHEQYGTYYSGGICEFEVYGFDPEIYEEQLSRAKEYQSDDRVREAADELRSYLGSESVYATHLKALSENLEAALAAAAEGTGSLPESTSADGSAADSGGASHGWVYAAAAAAVAVVAAAAAVIIRKRNKSGKN